MSLILVAVVSCEHEPLLVKDNIDGNIDPPVDTTICFERDILPIFKNSCAVDGCHNSTTHADEYVLDNYTNITKRGIVKFSANSSKIYNVIKAGEMPQYPISQLTQAQKDLIKKWINEGAKDGTNCPSKCDSNVYTFSGGIKPIIDDYCKSCHNPNLSQGGVDLTTYAGVQTVALNGKLMGSLTRTSNWMPYGSNKLSDCQMAQFRKWIQDGAKDN